MSAWILVPCLVSLRTEFDAVAPRRDRSSDGAIGDGNHTSSSDHTPDEDSDILRDHDADHKNEVHALDIDSSGPWPAPGWFDAAVMRIVDRHRRGEDDRLQYVIWNRQIANREIGNWKWRPYTSTKDPHTGHAHFSARYTTAQEQDTSPWDLSEDDMTKDELIAALNSDEGQAALEKAAGRGVHNQRLGRRDLTIGAAIERMYDWAQKLAGA